MHLSVSALSLFAGFLLLGSASAQQQYLVSDTGGDRVLTCVDLNQNGHVNDAGEIVVLYESALGTPPMTIAAGICPGPGLTVYLCDSTADVVMALTDGTNDGDALDTGEAVIFLDGRLGGNAQNVLMNSASSMFFDEATSKLWICTQNTAVAGSLDEILVVRDNNADLDANDLGEIVNFWTAPTGGPVNGYAPQGVAVESSTRIIYVDSGVASNKGAYSLTDLDNDGSAQDPGERLPFFVLPVPVPPAALQQLFCLERDAQGWYYMADQAYDTIYRFKDVDLDGDAMDAGESSVFYVSPAATTFWDLAAAPNGTIYVNDGTGAGHIYALTDLDADGDAQDLTEISELYDEGGGNPVVIDTARGLALRTLGTPSTPFCLGDGTGTACPCANSGAVGNGCASSSFAAGANLASSGIAGASAGTDTLVLTVTNIPGPGLFFQGDGQAAAGLGIAFGDGLLCLGGTLTRMGVVFPTGGSASYPGGTTPNPIHIAGGTASGDVRHYQCWYRDSPAFCTGDTYNLTQGLTLTWGP